MTSTAVKVKRVVSRLLLQHEAGVLLALVLVAVSFFLLNRDFFSGETLGDILTMSAELGVASIGVTFLMIAGEFDLSVGSNFALAAMLLAILARDGWPIWAALLLGLLAAAAIGGLNGLITVNLGIPSFIATLGMMMFWRGIALFLTGGWPVSIFGDPLFLRVLGGGRILGSLHISAVWWLLAAVVFWIALNKTRYGNWVFATGGKEGAARAMGVPARRVKLLNFILAGLLAGLAGYLQFGRMGSMSPVWGDQLSLEAIAAAVIGGTSLSGGAGTVIGTLLGTITMSAIRTGLIMVGAPGYWYMAFIGAILIVAVVINVKLRGAVLWRQ